MSEQTQNIPVEEKLKSLQDQLKDLAWVGGRAVDALDLINKASFTGSDAAKVARTTAWLENVAKDISMQAEEVQKQISALSPATVTGSPQMEVISPETPAAPAPEAIAAAQDQSAGEMAPTAPDESVKEIGEAADTLK